MHQDALLPFDNPSPSYNINQNFTNIQKNKQNTLTLKGKNLCGTVLAELACFAFCSSVAVLFFIFKIYPVVILFAGWSLFLGILWTVLYATSIQKVEFFKNEDPNQLILKITKKFRCSKQYTLMLENSYLFCQGDIILLI